MDTRLQDKYIGILHTWNLHVSKWEEIDLKSTSSNTIDYIQGTNGAEIKQGRIEQEKGCANIIFL